MAVGGDELRYECEERPCWTVLVLVLILALFSILGCGGGGLLRVCGEQTGPRWSRRPSAEQVDDPAAGALPSSVPADTTGSKPRSPTKTATVAVPAVIGMSSEEASIRPGRLGLPVVTSGRGLQRKDRGRCHLRPGPVSGKRGVPGISGLHSGKPGNGLGDLLLLRGHGNRPRAIHLPGMRRHRFM